MKEERFLKIIKSITDNNYIGDDCAYLKELGIVISQDSLVENIHFSMDYTTPYQLGYKAVMVNISDIAASGAIPKYITVALSLPKNIDEKFIKEFYEGCKFALGDAQIIGGDITGSEKIMISITAIGVVKDRFISSRKNAKERFVIVTSGDYGSSAAGLKLLKQNVQGHEDLKKSHIMPKAQIEFASIIAKNIKENYAMMDTSDGLADALFKIAKESNKTIELYFDKILYNKKIKEIFPNDYEDIILYGGEDYQIVAAIPEEFAQKYNLNIIGRVMEKIDNNFVKVQLKNKTYFINDLENTFNHF